MGRVKCLHLRVKIFTYTNWKCWVRGLKQLTKITRTLIKEIQRKTLLSHQNLQVLPGNLRLFFYSFYKIIGQSLSLELTRSSANVSESNVVISERNSLAFSFPRFDAKTRNWASRAASRARETVTEEQDRMLVTHNCQRPNSAYRRSSAWSFISHFRAMTSNGITYIILTFPLEKGKGGDDWTGASTEHTHHLVTMKNASHSTFESFFPLQVEQTHLQLYLLCTTSVLHSQDK